MKAGGKPSTWFPPGGLVEPVISFSFFCFNPFLVSSFLVFLSHMKRRSRNDDNKRDETKRNAVTKIQTRRSKDEDEDKQKDKDENEDENEDEDEDEDDDKTKKKMMMMMLVVIHASIHPCVNTM